MRCKSSASAYAAQRRRKPSADAMVPARPVRDALHDLRRKGIGLRQVAKLANVSRQTLVSVMNHTTKRVRRSTARRIAHMSIQHAPGAVVSSWQTKRMLRMMVSEGFNAQAITQAIPALKRQRHTCRAATELALSSLCHRLTA